VLVTPEKAFQRILRIFLSFFSGKGGRSVAPSENVMDSNYTIMPPDSNVKPKLFHKQFLKERDSKNDNASRRNSPISAISAAFNPHLHLAPPLG